MKSWFDATHWKENMQMPKLRTLQTLFGKQKLLKQISITTVQALYIGLLEQEPIKSETSSSSEDSVGPSRKTIPISERFLVYW